VKKSYDGTVSVASLVYSVTSLHVTDARYSHPLLAEVKPTRDKSLPVAPATGPQAVLDGGRLSHEMEGLVHPVLEKSNEKDAEPLTARASEGLSVMVAPPTVRTAERVVTDCVPTVTVARYCDPLTCDVNPEITRDV
jgi:hypothetical protein